MVQVQAATLLRVKELHDAQLVDLKLGEGVDDSKKHLACLRIPALAQDKWDEFVVDVEKMAKWARTWPRDEHIEIALTEDEELTYATGSADGRCYYHGHAPDCHHAYRPGMRLRLTRGTSLIQFYLIRSEMEGVEPLLLEERDGVLLPPAPPDKQVVKQKRRLLAIDVKLKSLNRTYSKAWDACDVAQKGMQREQERYEEAISYVNTHSFSEAVKRSMLVREVRRMTSYLETLLESPEMDTLACEVASWFTRDVRLEYTRAYVRDYAEPWRKYSTYAPKSWNATRVSEERRRRMDKVQRARSILERMVMQAYDEFLMRNFGLHRWDGNSYNWRVGDNFQRHRKQIRSHQREHTAYVREIREQRAVMERTQKEFALLRREKEEIQNVISANASPVTADAQADATN
jgi:hypothetical protein